MGRARSAGRESNVSWLAVGLGAAIGAWLRWGLSVAFNGLATLPLGTLIANLTGGFLIGVAAAFFASNEAISQSWRLFIMTGFLGGLTTFSTFSLESIAMLQRGDAWLAFSHTLVHLLGALAMCATGFACYRALQ